MSKINPTKYSVYQPLGVLDNDGKSIYGVQGKNPFMTIKGVTKMQAALISKVLNGDYEGASNQSQLIKDGMPAFYVNNQGFKCTHKMGDEFNPVYCNTEAAEALLGLTVDSI